MPARIAPLARLRTLARLRRVNKQLALWDELDAMGLMPPTLRPHVPVPELERPGLPLGCERVPACFEGDEDGADAAALRERDPRAV